MDYSIILLAAVGIFTASLFSTVSGFGFALVAMPFLTQIMPVKTAIIFIILMNLLLRLINMYQVRKEFDWNTVLMTTIGSLVGMYPGSMVLKLMPAAQLEIFLGLVLLTATLLLSLQCTVKITNKTAGRFGAGMIAGFFGASTSVNGPPLALYFLNEKTDKNLMRANLVWFFGLSGAMTVVTNYFAGNVHDVNWPMLLCCTPAMFVGILAGEKLFFCVPQELFRKLALVVVLIGASIMLYSGWCDL